MSRDGWEMVPLADVAYLAGRIGWKGLTKKEYTEEGPYFLSVHGLNYGDFVDFRDAFHISQERYDESPEIMLQGEDVLLCKDGAGIGKVGIVNEIPGPSTINSSLLLIRACERLLPKFLYYNFLGPYFQRIVQDRIDGATTPHLYQKDIKTFVVPVPEESEQKRIVSILDEAFAAIERAKENAEKNLANARELFDSYLNRIFTQKGEGWEEKKLGTLSQINSGGTPLKSTKEFWDGGTIPWYSSGELNDLYTTSSKNCITEKGLNGSNAKLFPEGSLLMGMYDTAALKMSILDREGTFNQAVAGMMPSTDIDIRFILYALKHIRPEVLKLRRGVRQKNLSLAKIKAIEISIPDKKGEQTKVVDQIVLYKNETTQLESIYQQKLDNLDELKQSLLQKAFTGQLTAKQLENEVTV